MMPAPQATPALPAVPWDALLRARAVQSPAAVALVDASGALSAADFDAACDAMACRFVTLGLMPGERVVLSGGADRALLTCLVGALRAGLDVGLAPLTMDAASLIFTAQSMQASALIGPADYADIAFHRIMFEAAAKVRTVRLVCISQGAAPDGAVHLNDVASDVADVPQACGHIFTISDTPTDILPIRHDWSQLLSTGHLLSACSSAAGAEAIVSLLSPISFAGFCLGPLAGFVGQKPLHLIAPFSSGRLAEALAACGPNATLVVPQVMLADILRSGLDSHVGGLHVLCRADVPFEPVASAAALVVVRSDERQLRADVMPRAPQV